MKFVLQEAEILKFWKLLKVFRFAKLFIEDFQRETPLSTWPCGEEFRKSSLSFLFFSLSLKHPKRPEMRNTKLQLLFVPKLPLGFITFESLPNSLVPWAPLEKREIYLQHVARAVSPASQANFLLPFSSLLVADFLWKSEKRFSLLLTANRWSGSFCNHLREENFSNSLTFFIQKTEIWVEWCVSFFNSNRGRNFREFFFKFRDLFQQLRKCLRKEPELILCNGDSKWSRWKGKKKSDIEWPEATKLVSMALDWIHREFQVFASDAVQVPLI